MATASLSIKTFISDIELQETHVADLIRGRQPRRAARAIQRLARIGNPSILFAI